MSVDVVIEERTALYRLFTRSGLLLYVGITRNPKQRFAGHASDKDWWPDVAVREIEWFESREAAEVMEQSEIRDKGPLHNKVHQLPPASIMVNIPGTWAIGLEELHRMFFYPAENTVALTVAALLYRELAARGLVRDPRCYHPPIPWPDGVIVDKSVCDCGDPMEPNGMRPRPEIASRVTRLAEEGKQ